jgi:hypothetical protein
MGQSNQHEQQVYHKQDSPSNPHYEAHFNAGSKARKARVYT